MCSTPISRETLNLFTGDISTGRAMKTAHCNLHIAVLTISLALLSLVTANSVAADKKPIISKKELKVLLKTATEPADHLKIAEHYRQEAARLTASSKEHAELADIYAKTPPHPMVSKHGDTFGQGASHCKKWAELQAGEAKESLLWLCDRDSIGQQSPVSVTVQSPAAGSPVQTADQQSVRLQDLVRACRSADDTAAPQLLCLD
jgi:hypothetical protein